MSRSSAMFTLWLIPASSLRMTRYTGSGARVRSATLPRPMSALGAISDNGTNNSTAKEWRSRVQSPYLGGTVQLCYYAAPRSSNPNGAGGRRLEDVLYYDSILE